MAADKNLDGVAKVLDGVSHNFATGKLYRGDRAAIASQRSPLAGFGF